jgi:tetratricopeptide (TPR) repeat protein
LSSIIAISSAKDVRTHFTVRTHFIGHPVAIVALCVCLLWPALTWSTRQQEEPEPEVASEGEVLLERWQAEAARQWAEKRLVSEPQHPVWRFLLGEALFELGHYAEALETLDSLLKVAPHPRIQAYREFVAQTIQSTATLQPIETAHFRIFLDLEKDAALASYVAEVLEQSYQRLGEIFRFTPTEKMRVEIFPTTATFYPASSLSTRDIEVSGAIGICKFNKIMLLSPRNLARGYRWTDALSHEYIHYIVVQLSHNRAPIWLHEGIAKYFESAWRLPPGAWLDRRSESLLAHALRHNSFVGLKNMDPSLVKLDTTYQVQLAYAEASSAIDFIVQQRGAEGLLGVLQALRQTREGGAAEAVARVMGMAFDTFQEQWQQFLVAKQLQEHQGVHLPRFELKPEGKMPTDELQQELQSNTARLQARLGDRLRHNGRAPAAAAEYRRALTQDPYSPYLLNKLASVLMAQGEWQQALSPLQRAQQLSSDDAVTYTNLGRLYVALQDFAQARAALLEAVQINPFDPAIHMYLAESYRQLGQSDKAQQEQQLFETLQRTQ